MASNSNKSTKPRPAELGVIVLPSLIPRAIRAPRKRCALEVVLLRVLHVADKRPPAQDWESLLNSSRNPLAPTLLEAVSASLDDNPKGRGS